MKFGLVVLGAHIGIHIKHEISKIKDSSILLVEPVPHNIRAINENLKEFKNIHLEPVAVSSVRETKDFFFVKATSINKLKKHWASGIGSFNKNHLLNHRTKRFLIEEDDIDKIPIKTVKKYRIQASEILESKKELFLTEKEAEKLIKTMPLDSLVRIIKIKTYNEDFFPNNLKYNWNEDQFGPLTIPKAGDSVEINKVSFPLYKKIIQDYEKNDVKVLKDRILINNQEIKTYTFKQDYFWMMGDNRHNSEDSRSWGFVPEDHIIGKPVFIWMSIDGFMDGISNWKPRWDRIFSTVGGEGERKSYFGYFIGLLIIWQVLVFVRKRRKTN